MVEEWNTHGKTVEERLWNSKTCDAGTVKHVMVEHWNLCGGTVEQRGWNSRTSDKEKSNKHGGTVEHLMVKQ